VTSPQVYESIESEQYVFPAVKEDGISSSHTKFQMNEERSAAVSNVLRQVGRARNGGKFKI
jgi:hypothetical protein